MTARTPSHRGLLGFRGRLAISIAGTFIVLGCGLVAVQLLVLSRTIARTITGSIGTGEPISGDDSDFITDSSECVVTTETTDCEFTVPDETSDYGQIVATEVTGSYVLWSVGLLVVFALIAAVLAWVLTRSPARKIDHITELARDISEHDLSRRLELSGPRDEITDLGDRIDTMLSRLEDAFASQDQFVANASHELRTPVTAIRAALEAPLSQGRVPRELEPYLMRALRSTERMDGLITASLLIARNRRLEPHHMKSLDLVDLVVSEVDELRASATARGVSVTVTQPEQPVVVHGNREALGIAVHNLVRNAIEHNRDHGRVAITILTHHSHTKASLRIENTGNRYSASEISELVRPFNRGRATRIAGTPGSGLGLTIVTSIAAAHESELSLEPGTPDGLIASLSFHRPKVAEPEGMRGTPAPITG